MLYNLCVTAIIVILLIAYKKELKALFSKILPKKDGEDSFVKQGMHDLRYCNRDCSHCKGKSLLLRVGVIFVAIFFCALVAAFITHASCPQEDTEDERPLKEVVLTVSSVKDESKDLGCKYVKFSDGHTIKITENFNGTYETKWVLAKEGDKVRKLIYANKEPEYTPEFDDNINKDSEK